jgi:hypothetical protein
MGKYVYPGLIDAHCHFVYYGESLFNVDLVGTQSFEEVVEKVKQHAAEYNADWIKGRGWDQNDWAIQEYPNKEVLDSLFPDKPVVLSRIDGHAALVNQVVLDMMNIDETTRVDGGIVELANGKPTGILIDKAMELVLEKMPKLSKEASKRAILQAQQNCFEVGLTTVSDAGLKKDKIDLIDELNKSGELKIRIYAMLEPSPENEAHFFKTGPYKTDQLHVCSFKIYADGALGSRGACLIDHYSDQDGHQGLMQFPKEHFEKYAKLCYDAGFQMNTHCIGDSANRLLLSIYGEMLKEKNDRRWRIEHAQIVHPDDMDKFGQYNIIPSVQTTHCTSDMYWVPDRLGDERSKTAYAYKELLAQNGMIANGTDFPVESINPMLSFYAAISRQDVSEFPDGGFQIENALTREEALKAMTIWAAFANFEEHEKGSLEPGKFADFVVLQDDLMTTKLAGIPDLKIRQTYLGGELVSSEK